MEESVKYKFKVGDYVIATKEYDDLDTPFSEFIYLDDCKDKLLKIIRVADISLHWDYTVDPGYYFLESDLELHPLMKLPLYQTLLEIDTNDN